VVRFYRDVAANVGRPILAYNNPWTMLTSMNAATVARLAEIPNVAGIKDSCNNAAQYQDELRQLGGRPDFSVLLGTTKLAAFGMFWGADGIIDGLHNIRPDWPVALWDAAQLGDWEGVKRWQLKLEALIPFANYEEWLGAVELVLREMGLCDKITARPLAPLSDSEAIAAIKKLMGELGLL
jgi:dihydrodipicolinate synthase/N-acetylneuraminate lyase